MNQLFMFGVATALTASIGISDSEAAVITRTVDITQGSSDPLLFEFDEISDVSELTSISDGSVSTDEGGTFTIEVREVDTNIFTEILGQNYALTGPTGSHGGSSSSSLSNLWSITFAPISIDAIRFKTDDTMGGVASRTNLPINTVFTFQGFEPVTTSSDPAPTTSIPVPGNTWLMLFGLAGIVASRFSFKALLP
jgi:hypothetical protein